MLKNIKGATDARSSVVHSATILANAYMHAGTSVGGRGLVWSPLCSLGLRGCGPLQGDWASPGFLPCAVSARPHQLTAPTAHHAFFEERSGVAQLRSKCQACAHSLDLNSVDSVDHVVLGLGGWGALLGDWSDPGFTPCAVSQPP